MIKLHKIYSLWYRIVTRIRKDLIGVLGLRGRENYFLDSPIISPRDDVNRIGIYAKAENFTVPHLMHKDDKVTYSFQRRYIYEIPNAIIEPFKGLVYDQMGKYIAESKALEVTRHLSEIPRPKIKIPSRELKGRYIFLPVSPTYYHWLIQDLPSFLGALEQAPDAKVLVGSRDFKPAQDFITRHLHNEVLRCHSSVQVERLVMVAKDGGQGNPFPPHASANPQDIRVLREYFKEHITNNEDTGDKDLLLYLSRSKWNRAHEGEEMLEQALEKTGFTIFHGNLDLFEQMKLFSKARLILGSSGAAMSNLTWAPPETTVVQMHISKNYYHTFYNLAHICGHDYHFLEVPKGSWSESDVDRIVTKVKTFI